MTFPDIGNVVILRIMKYNVDCCRKSTLRKLGLSIVAGGGMFLGSVSAEILLEENFDGLAPSLGPLESNLESGGDGTDWTGLAPTGWTVDTADTPARTDGRDDVTGDPASYDLVTQASYYAVFVERDARPRLQEVRDLRSGSVLLSVDSEAGSVALNFTVEESEDLTTWTPVEGTGVSQTLTLPEGKRFYRFAH